MAGDDDLARHYDTIVIGSGMGGLATASILARVGGERVLVLESHFKLGGFLHSFRRHGYTWDPGVHYIGDMSEGALTRQCMDLVTGGDIEWYQLGDRFERYLFPDLTFEVPSDRERHRARLIERFPAEEAAITRYFRDLAKVQRWSYRWFWSRQFGEPVASILSAGRRLATMRTADYLDARFRNPALKAVLTAQWPDYGVPPGRSAFGVHAIVAADFLAGGYAPVGGAERIVEGAVSTIEAAGGRCLTRRPVTEILISDGRARGVVAQTRSGPREISASKVVSAAGVDTTFRHLVGPDDGEPERVRLADAEPGPSAVVLFLGLNDDPGRHGFDDANYWLYQSFDHDATPEPGVFPPPILGAYLSFGSLRDPAQEQHTAQIITFSDYDEWKRFAGRPWRQRGGEYEELKDRFADQLLDFVDERLPGLRSLVDHRELGTPITVESFTGHPHGQIYGRASTPRRLGRHGWTIGTSVDNLYLTGTDLVVPGVNSALMIGVMTAGKLLGPTGTARVIHAARTPPPSPRRRRPGGGSWGLRRLVE